MADIKTACYYSVLLQQYDSMQFKLTVFAGQQPIQHVVNTVVPNISCLLFQPGIIINGFKDIFGVTCL